MHHFWERAGAKEFIAPRSHALRDSVTTTYAEGGTVTVTATVTNADGTTPEEGSYGTVSYDTDPHYDNEYLAFVEGQPNTFKILKAGTAYVTVGAGGNDYYAYAYKDVKVTINKAPHHALRNT